MNKMRARVALTMIVVGGLGVGGARTAQGQEGCGSGEVCLYDYTDYSGMLGVGTTSTPYVGDAANDRASSVINATPAAVVFYSEPNFRGFSVCLDPGTGYGNLSSIGLNNNISSFTLVPSCG